MHLQKAVLWIISQISWIWAKAGIIEAEYIESYGGYVNDEESVHNDSDESEKSPSLSSEPKEDKFDNIFLNRTRLEVCDQEVRINSTLDFTLHAVLRQ